MDTTAFSSLFVHPKEQLVTVLGNNLAQQFFATGVLGNGFAVLSNLRLYFKGFCFVRQGKQFSKRSEERVVDVRDITGTGFIHSNPIWLMWLGAAFLFLGVLFLLESLSWRSDWYIPLALGAIGGVILAIYKSKKRTLFEISFAGGGIAFDVSWFPAEEAQFFQKQIKIVSDSVRASERDATASASSADELSKFAALLAQGHITQEEYEAQKQRLLR